MEKLYEALNKSGKYTKSLEDFKTQFSSTAGQEKLYGALKSSGDYTKSFSDFSTQFFNTEESVKTNDSAAADPSVESNATGSNWVDGSSEQLDSGFVSENNRGKREKLIDDDYSGTMISRMFDDDPNNSWADGTSESFKDSWKAWEKNNPVFAKAVKADKSLTLGKTANIPDVLGPLARAISNWVRKDDAEDEAAINNNPELHEKYRGYRNDVSIEEQAEQFYNSNDLDLNDTNSNAAYNDDKRTDFIEEYYINNPESKVLLEEANVNASDFQGFLNRKGYIDEFDKQKEAGAYEQDDSNLPDNLTMQQDLKSYFDEYLIETASRNVERVVLEEIKNNPSEYKNMSLPEAMGAADVKLMEDPEKYNYGTHLDFNKLEDWNSNNWDSINKYNAEQIKNIEDAQQARIEETETGVKTGLYGSGRTLVGALNKLGDGLEDVYDFVKMDGKVFGLVLPIIGEGRQANEFRDLRDKSNRRALRGEANINYLYAEGKQVTLNGKEYIKQANGSIKQITNGFDVSKTISDKDRKAIDDAIANGDYIYGADFDGFGGSIIAGQTIGELAIQIVGQKGTGLLRRAASLKYLGKVKNLSKARLTRMELGYNKTKGINSRGINYGGVTGGAKGTWDTFGKKIPLGISKGMADAVIFKSGYGAMTGYNQAKTAALDAGMSMEESEAIANEASLGMAALFALTTPINPKTGLIDKIFKGTGKNSTASLFRQLINASGNAAGVRRNFGRIVAAPLQTKLAKFGAIVASEGAKEMVQENVQQIGEAALNKVLNKGIGKDLLKDTYTYEDFVNTSALSFAAGGFAGGVGSISTLTGRKNIMNDSEKVQKLRQLIQNPAKVEKIFDSWVKNGDITRKEADGLNQEIQKFGRNINKMPKFLSDRRMSTELLKVIDSQENISKLEKQRKNAIPGEQALIDEKLKVLKEQQTKLLVDAQNTLDADNKVFEGKFTKNTAAVVNFARKLGFGESKLPRIFENTDAYVTAIYRALKRKERSYLKAVKEGKIKADPDFKPLTKAEVAKQAAESDGVYLGAGSLFINKEMARQTGKWTVTSHEIIHPILNSLVGSYLNQKANYDDLMKILPAKVRRSINKKIAQTQGKEKQAIEFLNYLSDAVISGELDFDPSLFDKIRLWFNNIISKLGLKSGIENHEDLHFDDARGVYNWLKEFTSGLKEGGEISDKAVEAVQKAETKANRLVSEDPGLRDPENAMQFSSSQEILNLENALDDALDAFAEDPNNPTLEKKVEEAERLLEEAEERVASGRSAIKQEAKPKPKPKKKVEAKPVRTTDLGPRDPKSKKIMDTYNEGMEGVERTEYKASKPLPASLEKKLIPLFEGYINTIVQQKFKQVGPEALEFQDALSILRAEVASAIRTFNPAVNKDLAGYVKRYGVQARQSLMFADANKEFTSDISDAKGVVDTNDTPSIDRSGTVERGQRTFDELDIVDEDLINDIRTELEKEIRIRVQKGTLSETLEVKKGRDTYIVSWLENYIQKQLFKKLMKKLGAITGVYPNAVIPGSYIDFLNDPNTFDIITKALPIKSIKKSYGKLFPLEKVGREVTPEGNPVYRIKKIEKRDFLTYFVKGKKSAVLERQKQLFREILEPLAKQVVADYATPSNLSDLKSIQELAPENSLDVINDIVIEAQLANLESKIDRYKGEKEGFDIIQFSKELNQKDTIDVLEQLAQRENITELRKGVLQELINKVTNGQIRTTKDLIKAVHSIGKDQLSTRAYREYVVNVLSKLQFTLRTPSVANIVNEGVKEFTKIYKYQQKIIGYNYSTTKVKRDFDEATDDKSKVEAIVNYLNITSRSIRTLGVDGNTTNEKIFNNILVPAFGADQLSKLKIDLLKESYKDKDGKTRFKTYITVNKIKLKGLVQITELKSNFENNIDQVNKEAILVRNYLIDEINRAKQNNEVDAVIGFINLSTADQRGAVRKLSSTGMFMVNTPIAKLILEHETTAKQLTEALVKYAKGEIDFKVLTKILNGAKINLIPKKLDLILNKQGLDGIGRYETDLIKEEISKLKASGKLKFTQYSKSKLAFDPFDMADVVTMSLFGETKAFKNRQGFERTYKYLNPSQQKQVQEEMKKHNLFQFSKTLNQAKAMSNRIDAPNKGISVWDFDDTLATTKSNVLYTLPNGTKGKINATEFALQADQLAAQGAEFDFSEFSKVMNGAKGPMFDKAVARNKKFGNSNVYILTARPANSKYAIHTFLKGIGLDIKLENIFGLGDGTAIAKAKWVIGKVAEGYNDFYFADDAYKNVQAVQEVLEQADVKSKVHQAKIQFAKSLNSDFNNIIQDVTGIDADKKISGNKAKMLGKKKGRFKFFLPPSAEDFAGLLYKLTGKGKKGEAHQAWFKKSLFDPFAKGIREFESYKQNATAIVKQLKKSIKNIPAGLGKINETGFTNEAAVRVYLWTKNGFDIPDLTAEEQQELIEVVNNNPKLKKFADQLDKVLDGYPEPQDSWVAGTITTDAINMINTVKRAEFLKEWQENADAIFTKDNINKLRSQFGDSYVEALQDMLYRMKTGRNRPSGANKLTNRFMNWVNDSVGTIMFFNTRSALLQTLSIVNFINWHDNNPIQAAKAFANQKQFWSDFSMIFNSDFLKQRRSGLKNDVNADDIASAAENETNKAKAVFASLLKAGFLPTQIADSFAIAMGGASFIRNRINMYVAEGMTKAKAEEQAFLDFQEIAEETQQSSRPDRISQQQASPLGRIVLAFANTPMQYMRLSKKAFLDLKNGRGDAKTNITKIIYYTAVQNIIFSSLQAALFAVAFDDDEEKAKNKEIRVANSMLDSILRGTGIYGAIASTIKNIVAEIYTQSEKSRPDYTVAAQRALSISPPIDSKMRKIMSAARAFSYKTTREKMVGYGLDNPAYYAVGQILSAGFNLPVDRLIRKADNIRVALDNETKMWQSIALTLGYSQWDLGLIESGKNKKSNKKGWHNVKRGSWKD